METTILSLLNTLTCLTSRTHTERIALGPSRTCWRSIAWDGRGSERIRRKSRDSPVHRCKKGPTERGKNEKRREPFYLGARYVHDEESPHFRGAAERRVNLFQWFSGTSLRMRRMKSARHEPTYTPHYPTCNYRLSCVSWQYTWRARRNIERALWLDRSDPVTTERTIGRDSYLAYLVISDHKNEHKPTRFVR